MVATNFLHMKIGNITYHFIIYKSKINSKGKVPIYCRLRKDCSDLWVSTSIKISPKDYDSQREEIIAGPLINRKIFEAWKHKLQSVLLKSFTENSDISLLEVKEFVVGRRKKKSPVGILEVFSHHNNKVYKLIDKEYTKSTYDKYKLIYKQVEDFFREKYNKKDLSFRTIGLHHLIEFEDYLLLDRNLKQITVNKSIQRLKKIVKYAMGHDWLDKDPWILYKQKAVHTPIIYLSSEELDSLLKCSDGLIPKLERVKDLFIFQCFTGLGYAELAAFNTEDIYVIGNSSWIKLTRKKTGKTYTIPLLDPAIQILNKYNKVLPIISNQKYNMHLKDVAKHLKIEKKLTTHVARKTYASTILLGNNIPLKVASRLLAHSDSRVTEKHYAHIANTKLETEVEQLNKIYSSYL